MLILDTTDRAISVSYIDTDIEIDSWGRLKMTPNDTDDDRKISTEARGSFGAVVSKLSLRTTILGTWHN
jgi:hypothetical protein